MGNEIVYVVGDKYIEFTKNSGAITITNAIKIANIFLANSKKKKIYRIGQGVTVEKANELNLIIKNNRLEKYFEIENFALIEQRETKYIVHKHKEENIMITIPEEVSKNHYQSFLIMDDNCAESSDHITGQHIQGMVLIEAARQMMLSVTENYFLLPHEKEKSYFTLNKVNTNFSRFTFPVEIVINYQVMNITKKTNGSIKSTGKILFEQLGQTVAEIEIDFCVYSKDFIAGVEKTMAADTLQKALLTKPVSSSNRGDTLKIAYA